MSKNIKIDYKNLLVLSVLYIYIPVFIFVYGWTSIIVSTIFTLLTGLIVYRIFKNYFSDLNKTFIQIKIWIFVVTVILFLIIGYFAGWGRFVDQTTDWQKHNAILSDLVNRNWPVYYQNDGEYSMLTYYIFQYMVPALFGKLFNSFRVAEITLMIWNEIGLFLIYLNVVKYLNTKRILTQLSVGELMVFFCVPNTLAKKVMYFTANVLSLPINYSFTDNEWFNREIGGIASIY